MGRGFAEAIATLLLVGVAVHVFRRWHDGTVLVIVRTLFLLDRVHTGSVLFVLGPEGQLVECLPIHQTEQFSAHICQAAIALLALHLEILLLQSHLISEMLYFLLQMVYSPYSCLIAERHIRLRVLLLPVLLTHQPVHIVIAQLRFVLASQLFQLLRFPL